MSLDFTTLEPLKAIRDQIQKVELKLLDWNKGGEMIGSFNRFLTFWTKTGQENY